VDEGGLLAALRLYLLGEVHDGAAHPALAEERRGEEENHGLPSQHAGEVDGVHVVGRVARVDLLDVSPDAGCRRRVDAGGPLADVRHRPLAGDAHEAARGRRRHEPVVVARQAQHLVVAGLVEMDVGHVHGARGVGIGGDGPALELPGHLQRLVAGQERAMDGPTAHRRDVQGHRDVRDLVAGAVEEAETEAVLAGL
jgi:hypothetical protein